MRLWLAVQLGDAWSFYRHATKLGILASEIDGKFNWWLA